jgi:hypothetical protein
MSIMIPLRLGFQLKRSYAEYAIDVLLDVLMTGDIILIFRTGSYHTRSNLHFSRLAHYHVFFHIV